MIEVLWNTDGETAALSEDMTAAICQALSCEGRIGDVCLRLVGTEDIRAMNRDFRHVDAVTDVLTFPAWEGEELLSPPDGYMGDIAICYARAVEQAEAYGHSLRRELCFLAVHGALHLCGYDHMEPAGEARMLEKQEQILCQLKVER